MDFNSWMIVLPFILVGWRLMRCMRSSHVYSNFSINLIVKKLFCLLVYVGVLDALGRVFKVCLLNRGFLMVVLFFFVSMWWFFLSYLFFCHFGSGFFLPISSFCEQHQLIERSKCRVYRKKYCIIMGYKVLLFGFNPS